MSSSGRKAWHFAKEANKDSPKGDQKTRKGRKEEGAEGVIFFLCFRVCFRVCVYGLFAFLAPNRQKRTKKVDSRSHIAVRQIF